MIKSGLTSYLSLDAEGTRFRKENTGDNWDWVLRNGIESEENDEIEKNIIMC